LQTPFEGGEVVLTSHRLLWGRPGDIPRGLICLSLPLHYIVFVEEEMGSSSFGFSRSKKIVLHLSEALPGEMYEILMFKKTMKDCVIDFSVI
jgi:ESCRT-II complex subunit VPS36